MAFAKTALWGLALAAGISSTQAAEIGWRFMIEDGRNTTAALEFTNDLGNLVSGVAVASTTGVGQAWQFDLAGSGHGSDGGFFGWYGSWAWLDLTPDLFNNLSYLGNDTWLLETDQTTPSPNTQAFYGMAGFPLTTSLYAGDDSFNGDMAFASVVETQGVPEPSTIALVGLTLALLGATVRRQAG